MVAILRLGPNALYGFADGGWHGQSGAVCHDLFYLFFSIWTPCSFDRLWTWKQSLIPFWTNYGDARKRHGGCADWCYRVRHLGLTSSWSSCYRTTCHTLLTKALGWSQYVHGYCVQTLEFHALSDHETGSCLPEDIGYIYVHTNTSAHIRRTNGEWIVSLVRERFLQSDKIKARQKRIPVYTQTHHESALYRSGVGMRRQNKRSIDHGLSANSLC